MYSQENKSGRRAGENPYQTVEEAELETRELRWEAFRKGNPDFKAKAISEYEFAVRERIAKIIDGKRDLEYIREHLDPRVHWNAKITEHGKYHGLLPAAFFAVFTPLLRGVPEALALAPGDFFKVKENMQQLRTLVEEKGTEGYNWSHLPDDYKVILQEVQELRHRVRGYELEEKFAN